MTKDKNDLSRVDDALKALDKLLYIACDSCYQDGEQFLYAGIVSDALGREKCETKRQRLITRYLAAIKKHNEGWKPDWSNDGSKCFHVWRYDNNSVDYDYTFNEQLKLDDWYMRDGDTPNKVAAEFTDAEMKLILTGKE